VSLNHSKREETQSVICLECQGKGWLRKANGWPTECGVCTPTKQVKGKTVLDVQAIKRRAIERKPPPSYVPMQRVKVNETTHQFHAYDDEA
jgi:hypothetical protein